MDSPDQIAAFESDLKALINRYRAEFELTLASAMGTLEIVKLELWQEQRQIIDEDEE